MINTRLSAVVFLALLAIAVVFSIRLALGEPQAVWLCEQVGAC